MSKITYLTPDFAVAGQLSPADFKRAAEAGFQTIVNNRPDQEERGQLDAEEGRQLAASHGLQYAHVPTNKHEIFTDEVVQSMAAALATSRGPTLAHCKSGQRSAILWAAVKARSLPVAEVLAKLEAAGLDFGFLRDELERQADRGSWSASLPEPERIRDPAQARSQAAA